MQRRRDWQGAAGAVQQHADHAIVFEVGIQIAVPAILGCHDNFNGGNGLATAGNGDH
jgi:hypothetical protein